MNQASLAGMSTRDGLLFSWSLLFLQHTPSALFLFFFLFFLLFLSSKYDTTKKRGRRPEQEHIHTHTQVEKRNKTNIHRCRKSGRPNYCSGRLICLPQVWQNKHETLSLFFRQPPFCLARLSCMERGRRGRVCLAPRRLSRQ